jgi:FkbM family methyltransferase
VGAKSVAFNPFGDRTFSITGDESDIGVVGELERSGGRYAVDLGRFARRTLARDAVVVDGGAHIGVVTVLLASLCPDGRVYSFEPAAATRAHLVANVAANALGNVEIEPAAIGATDGEISFAFDAVYPAGSHVGGSGETVPATTLDSWARARGLARLDLVKLDLEGCEVAALAGAEATIRRFRPTMVVECNPVALRRFGGRTYRELFAEMKARFPLVGVLDAAGAFLPILTSAHLDLVLGDRGVVDLVGIARRDVRRDALARIRSARDLAQLSLRYNTRHPTENKVVDPAITLAPGVDVIAGEPGACLTVPVRVQNRTRWWLSSAFPYHPVHLAYRVLDPSGARVVAEGHRSTFAAPLAPGGSATIDATVQLPPTPGDYRVVVTLVQEAFAWLDELNPQCAAEVRAHVG